MPQNWIRICSRRGINKVQAEIDIFEKESGTVQVQMKKYLEEL